ncbi:MAG: universal stress protein [Bacteroidales bacterium]|nr:universal stress protein [Bacteroidales bacterium]
MKKNNVILIPTDFSEVCENAINHGINIAKFINYEIVLLHVVNKHSKAYLRKEKLQLEYIDNKLTEIAQKIVDEYGINVKTISKEGSIFSVIPQIASEINASLLLLGTHGKIGFQNLTGSFAMRIIYSSPASVLVVHKKVVSQGFKKIVLPIYNSKIFKSRLSWTVNIAKIFNSEVLIFKIFETNPQLIIEIDETIKYFSKEFEENKIPYFVNKAEKGGQFAEQLIEFSISNRADLILITTNADEYDPSFLLGPWEEKMIFNTSQIPVMCINPSIKNFDKV